MTFGDRLRAGERLLGPLVRMPNETLIELTGYVGMDFVVIDTEHGPSDQIPLGAHLSAAGGAGIGALVRVGNLHEILRVLDLGADGIIVPHVGTVQQARDVVAAAHYPPRGARGFATYTRAGRHGLSSAAEHLERAAGTVVIAMIEDGPGVDAAGDIAGVDGIDGLFVGPADLAVALGHPGEQAHPDVVAAIARVHTAARAAGKAVVAITGDATGARTHVESGATVVIYNVTAALDALFISLASAGATATSAAVEPIPRTDPIVLLPGMMESPALWDGIAERLAPRAVRALRLDLDDTIAGMAESVLAQAPPRFALAGHSLGATVALEIIARAPHRVSRLALINGSARGPSPEQLVAWQRLIDRIDSGAFAEVADEESAGNAGDREDLLSSLRAVAEQVGPQGLRRQLQAQTGRADQRQGLRDIAVPTLVITGADDRICPADRQEEMAAAIPRARHETIQECGHVSPLAAAEQLAVLLRDFL